MFTGVITHTGKLEGKQNNRLTFSAPPSFLRKLKKGTSVSVNGVCLTILENPTKRTFGVEIMPETARRTMFAALKTGDIVNLELPATADTLLSGHLVQGHVDGIGIITKIEQDGASKLLTVKLPTDLIRYVVDKGSIAVNGISLTIVDVGKNFLTVAITPFTWRQTMLSTIQVGDPVNIETDIMAKYLEKLMIKK